MLLFSVLFFGWNDEETNKWKDLDVVLLLFYLIQDASQPHLQQISHSIMLPQS